MIYRLVVVAAFFCTTVTAIAQDRVQMGLKLGVTSSEIRETIDGAAFGGLGFRFGLNGGGFLSVPIRGPLGALVEANYYRKGYGSDGEIRDENNLQTGRNPRYDYDYASALVAFRYREALGSGGTDFYAFFGPRLDILVGDRASFITAEGNRESMDLPGLLRKEDLNTLQVGGATGFGIDLSRRGTPLLIELRYDADATPVGTQQDGNSRERAFRFRAFSIRLGASL